VGGRFLSRRSDQERSFVGCSRSLARHQRLPGNGWWEQPIQVEALAALAAWVERYDSGEWDDPPGKLGLLYDVERVRELIGGGDPFYPDRDRAAFVRFVIDAGCQPPPAMGGEATLPPDRRR
jgi:hypothetical protein